MRLYAAFLGLVSHPHPRGALKPIECLTTRFQEVRAAMRLFSDGVRKPNFMLLRSDMQTATKKIQLIHLRKLPPHS